MARSLTQRMMGAAMLDVSVYEEVEHDLNATGQAAAVVAIVAVCQAIGASRGGIGAIIGAFLSWGLWALLTWFIGTKLFRGTATVSELLRTLGFAMAPGVLYILGIIPILGGLIGIVVWIWTLVAGVIAIRQALDFDTTKAVLTAVISWIVVIVVGLVLAGLATGASALGGLIG
jgi:hypothetical protein